MSLRRTSVLLDVEDSLYYEVVEPMKRNKSFTKLVVALLNGYNSDSYIRAYIDDNLEEVHRAIVGSFENSVGDMESALANMGLFSDELKARTVGGYKRFSEKAEKAKQDCDRPTETVKSDTKSSDYGQDVDELKRRVSDIEKTMSEGFERVISLISSYSPDPAQPTDSVSSSVSAVDLPSDVVHKYHSGAVGNEETGLDIPITSSELFGDDINKDSDSIGKEEANSFLSSLMADFSSF